MIETKNRIKIGGIKVTEDMVSGVVEILKDFDRMPNNPDEDFLVEAVGNQLIKEGLIRLMVFACPKFNTCRLFSDSPEEYIPVEAKEGDLFGPRMPKIDEIRQALFRIGVVSTLEVIIGDNDFESYILPFLPELNWSYKAASERCERYCESFSSRVGEMFGFSLTSVWSLSDLGITIAEKAPIVNEDQIVSEIKFFNRLFSGEGPYKGNLAFSEQVLRDMALLKFQAYGAQGVFLEELGGVLLQTEGPELWLQRTQILRSTGAGSVPAIYPWIRRDEVKEIKKGD